MNYRVPFVDARTHYARLKSEIDSTIIDCLTNGDLIYRRQLRQFEENFARFVGTKFAVGLNSGYHALEFALRAARVGPGDEVVTVAHTFVATISAIVNCGAKPVLVDVASDYTMNPEVVEAAITCRTKVLLPVHLNGRVCRMDRITEIARRHGLQVIEDAAQALGASFKGINAGTFGLAGCFSFYPFKVLGGFGDGGALVTNDPDVARKASLMRFNGEDRETGEYYYHGQTALLDNVQAAVLDVKLKHLPSWLDHRRKIAKMYHSGLTAIAELRIPPFDSHDHHDIFQNYVLRTPSRDALRTHLAKAGIETLTHWPKPVWEHNALQLAVPDAPETRAICNEVLSLPMSAETTVEHVEHTVGAVRSFFAVK